MTTKEQKKIYKIHRDIEKLENELFESLTKKSSTTKEINVGEQQIKINKLRRELQDVKNGSSGQKN